MNTVASGWIFINEDKSVSACTTMTAVYCESHMKAASVLCGQNILSVLNHVVYIVTTVLYHSDNCVCHQSVDNSC